jgi:hypothetical protein
LRTTSSHAFFEAVDAKNRRIALHVLLRLQMGAAESIRLQMSVSVSGEKCCIWMMVTETLLVYIGV